MKKLAITVAIAILIFWLTIFWLTVSKASDPGSDLPKSEPVSSTGFLCKLDGEIRPIVIVMSYKDGSVARFDSDDMHGFTWEQAAEYANSVKDSMVYSVACKTKKESIDN